VHLPVSVERPSLAPIFDESSWPIFLVTQPAASLSVEEYRRFLGEITQKASDRHESFVLLIQASKHERPDALRRKAIAEEMQRGLASGRLRLRGLGIIVESRIEIGTMTALTWLARPPYPMAAFDGVAKAKEWANKILAGHTQDFSGR
jgi:hypothetical protein